MKSTLQNETRQDSNPAASQEFQAPEVNIFGINDGYVLEAEMPGVNKDGLHITLEGTEITIVGHRSAEVAPGQALVSERRAADYRRVFELDPAIDTGKIAARMEQGVLTLTLPKSEQSKPRKIAVD